MSWYRDSDGKIITDEEYRNDCMECECFCQEGMVNIPCNGERTDCPHFKEVDTSDYDKEIRNKAIDTFMIAIETLVKLHGAVVLSEIQEIAERMKEGRVADER